MLRKCAEKLTASLWGIFKCGKISLSTCIQIDVVELYRYLFIANAIYDNGIERT